MRDRIFVIAGQKLQPVNVGADMKLSQDTAVTLDEAPTHVAAGAGVLYLGYASGRLESWSAPPGGQPIRLGAVELGGETRGLVTNGSKVIALAVGTGMNVVSFDVPGSPSILLRNTELDDPKRARLFGRMLVVELERGWVSAIDVSRADAPRAVTTNKDQKPGWVGIVDGNLVFGTDKDLSVAGVPPTIAGRITDSVRNDFPVYGSVPVRFSKRIDDKTAESVKLRCDGKEVAGRAIVTPDRMGLSFRADADLPTGASCELDLSALRDTVGLALSPSPNEGQRFAFKTSSAKSEPIINPGSKYPHTDDDGRFTGFTAGSGEYEWSDVKSAKGMFTRFYADFDGQRLYILNDWVYSDEKISPDCYNRFLVWTAGGQEQWEVRAYGDQRVEVRKNGTLVDPKSEGVRGGAYFGSSPNRESPHTIYEISLPAGAGQWGVQLHDPGPTFKCDKLEGEPTSVVGAASTDGGNKNTIDPTLKPKAPSVPVAAEPANDATDVSLTPRLRWTSSDDWKTFSTYRVQIARDQTFAHPIELASGAPFVDVPAGALRAGTQYFWRVIAQNGAGSATSEPWRFTTAQALTCEPSFADCDKNPQNGCEVNTSSDAAHCGSCGNACGAGLTCVGGQCVETDGGTDAGTDGGVACTSCLASSCSNGWATCSANSECVAIVSCIVSTCAGSSDCAQSCMSQHPQGLTAFQPLYQCLAQSCGGACFGTGDAGTGGTGGTGGDASLGGTGGTDGGSPCTSCLAASCPSQWAQCTGATCSQFLQCLSGCSDMMCAVQCANQTDAASALSQLADCADSVCKVCYASQDGGVGGTGGTGGTGTGGTGGSASNCMLLPPEVKSLSSQYSGPLALGDFKKDGYLDVLAAPLQNGAAKLVLGPPPLTLGTDVTVNGPNGVHVGDFNADGKDDLLAVSGAGATVHLGVGDGTFGAAKPVVVSEPTGAALGDYNGDGRLDVAWGTFGNVWLTLGNGDGTFQAATAILTSPQQVLPGDFNKDGKADFAVLGSVGASYEVWVMLGTGSGTFTKQTGTKVPSSGNATVVDVNDDTHLDVLVANGSAGTVSVLIGKGDGTFQASVDVPAGPNVVHATAGKINADSMKDLVVANDNGVSAMFMLQGPAQFYPPVSYNVGGKGKRVLVANIDKSKGDDIVVTLDGATSGQLGSVAVLYNACP